MNTVPTSIKSLI
jgi:hypothetical protein